MPNDGPKAPTQSPYDPVTIVDDDIVIEGPESSCEGRYEPK